jgi:hypothetical protein
MDQRTAYTGHWISPDLVFQSALLSFVKFDECHTKVNIESRLEETLHDYGIKDKITMAISDSGRNVVAGINGIKSLKQLPCIGHRINSICSDMFKQKNALNCPQDHIIFKLIEKSRYIVSKTRYSSNFNKLLKKNKKH